MYFGKKVHTSEFDELIRLDMPSSKQNRNKLDSPVRQIKNVFGNVGRIRVKPISNREAIKLQGRIGLVVCKQAKLKD